MLTRRESVSFQPRARAEGKWASMHQVSGVQSCNNAAGIRVSLDEQGGESPGQAAQSTSIHFLAPHCRFREAGFGLLALSFVKVFIKYSCLWDWELGGGGTGRKEMISIR